ncbi:hypothetical protein SHIRM173S_11345 [Streptomyces hirsutus]
MKLSPRPLRAVLAAASSAALAMMVFPGPAHAEPERGPEVRQAGASPLAPCGFFRYNVRESQFAGYNHCGETTVRVHVDVRGAAARMTTTSASAPAPRSYRAQVRTISTRTTSAAPAAGAETAPGTHPTELSL